ncbi:hypothetical protein NESM_000323200 [Novymonas esmeraldas]|uniref:Uncharacterized protein n=1 Tax=Novymonas esmeraldas TaxID=1808958 RepID=A0AAW0EMK1_9TRYP
MNGGATTAHALQRLLEAEGAVIHAAVQARAVPSMGGGMGVVLTEKLAAGTSLARFPFRSMITARKARFNLAMAEVALERRWWRGDKDRARGDPGMDGVTEEEGLENAVAPERLRIIPFTSRVWSDYEFESHVRSQQLRQSIESKVAELEQALDSTETIVCYVLLMAALYGRWANHGSPAPSHGGDSGAAEEASVDPVADVSAGGPRRATAPTLHYTHENAWMRTWIHALPAQYDNLLELTPQSAAPQVPSVREEAAHVSPPPSGHDSQHTRSLEWLRAYIALGRFQAGVVREQQAVRRRYRKCCAALQCLRCLPTGVEVRGVDRDAEAEDLPTGAEVRAGVDGGACTLEQYLWAFNTLMSRGFFFPEETWAMMPFVDYFNYALDSNGTMYPQDDEPNDPASFTNALLDRDRCRTNGDGAPTTAASAAARRQRRRTGLRTVRVGKDAVPLANYQTYEFQLVRPTRTSSEQVMLHYGAYSDVELLMWYGFTLRPSLLPLTHFIGAPQDHMPCTVLPVLPPGLSDEDGSLVRTALALRLALRELATAATRVSLFRRCVAPMCSGDVTEEGPDAEEEEEEAYGDWRAALDRAYQLPLSPIADAEGNYPAGAQGATWLDDLLRDFCGTPALADPGENATAEAGVAFVVDAWLRGWAREQWPLFAVSAFPHINKECNLGAMSLSPVLRAAVHSSFWAPSSQQLRLTAQERVLLVRGIAWAELRVTMAAAGAAAGADPSASPPTSAPASTAAAAFARVVSVDHWTLLRFLAFEGTDDELVAYVQRASKV